MVPGRARPANCRSTFRFPRNSAGPRARNTGTIRPRSVDNRDADVEIIRDTRCRCLRPRRSPPEISSMLRTQALAKNDMNPSLTRMLLLELISPLVARAQFRCTRLPIHLRLNEVQARLWVACAWTMRSAKSARAGASSAQRAAPRGAPRALGTGAAGALAAGGAAASFAGQKVHHVRLRDAVHRGRTRVTAFGRSCSLPPRALRRG